MTGGTELRLSDAAWVQEPARPSSTQSSRRGPARANHVVHIGPFAIDFDSRIVRRRGIPVHLSRLEFDILAVLSSPPGMLVTREEFLERLWPGKSVTDTRTLDTHVRRLRMKLEEEPSRPRYLVTIRGVGFRMDP